MSNWQDSRTARILIIDDNPNIHRDFDSVLLDNVLNPALEADEQRLFGQAAPRGISQPAYMLDHALSGIEGIERVRQALAEDRPYQLAFVDIRMPGIDGVETIERVWQIDPAIQVVICTAFADYSWEGLARRLGPTDKLLVLKKPFDNIEVTQLASTLAEKWFLARQAALKLEQMELLIAQRTQKLLDLQQRDLAGAAEPGLNTSRLVPLSPASPEEFEPPGEPPPASGKDLPLILVVADKAELCSSISQALGSEYRVIEAKDGETGLRKARETVPDLIFADVVMPRHEGIALCRRLKAEELTSHIPVITLADSGLEDSQVEALEVGADDYITRPFSQAVLKARADNLLRSRRRLHEHFSHEVTLHPRDIAANQVDAVFLRRTLEIVEKHLPDFEFDVEALAQKLAVSRRQLFRKLKAVTGRTPNAFIRAMRLNRAAQLLKESQMTVTEITYAVGFSDLKHFRTVFRDQFGVLPGEYTKSTPRENPR